MTGWRKMLLCGACLMICVLCGCDREDDQVQNYHTDSVAEGTTDVYTDDNNAGHGNAAGENTDTAENSAEEDADFTNEETNQMIYVALGDSLTKGFGLNDAEHDRFSAVAAKKMNDSGVRCNEVNYGVNGLESGELLGMIENGDTGMLELADAISVDIGANDILHSTDDLIYTNLAGNTMSADDYDVLCSGIDSNLDKCRENTENIIDAIRDINDHARIIIFTIYNPYRNVDLELMVEGQSLNLADFTDSLVCRLNDNIREIAREKECTVGDWYTAFQINPNNLVNAAYGEDVVTDFDIHPNKNGHAVMGEVCYQAMKK